MANLEPKTVTLEIPLNEEDVPRVIMAIAGIGKRKSVGEQILLLRPRDGTGVGFFLHPSGQVDAWRCPRSSDVPGRTSPEKGLEFEAAVRELNHLKAYKGMERLHNWGGKWTGRMIAFDAETAPTVRLQRKVASYAWLYIQNEGASWKWRVAREEKYYSKSKDQSGQAPYLKDAIAQGLAAVLGLVGEVCAIKDSHSRRALDPAWAEAHPLKARPESDTDRLDKLKEPRPKQPAPKEKAPKEKTPKEKTPKEKTPKEKTPKEKSEKKPRAARAKAAPTLEAPPQATNSFQFPGVAPSVPGGVQLTAPAIQIDPATAKLIADAFALATQQAIAEIE